MSAPVWKISDEWSRRPLQVLFWASSGLLAAGVATADPLVGILLVGVPLVLVVLVRQWGLGGIPTTMFVGAIVVSWVPAGLVLGHYRADLRGQLAIGFLIFLVWVAAYPMIVRHMDRQYLREHFSFPDGSVPREPLAEFRVQLITLWLTVMIMLMVGELLVAAFVAFALLCRRRWTAVTAASACLVLPVITIRLDGIVWDARPLVVLAALVAAHQWAGAIKNPLWEGAMSETPG